MANNKLIKWCVATALFSGLSACNTEMQHLDQIDTDCKQPVKTAYQPVASKQAKAVQKTYASKDPTQQATPGPVRQAAPQLPVIQ